MPGRVVCRLLAGSRVRKHPAGQTSLRVNKGRRHFAIIEDAQCAPPDPAVGGHGHTVGKAAIRFDERQQPLVSLWQAQAKQLSTRQSPCARLAPAAGRGGGATPPTVPVTPEIDPYTCHFISLTNVPLAVTCNCPSCCILCAKSPPCLRSVLQLRHVHVWELCRTRFLARDRRCRSHRATCRTSLCSRTLARLAGASLLVFYSLPGTYGGCSLSRA